MYPYTSIDNKLLQKTGSQRQHDSCPLVNKAENIDHMQVWTFPSRTPWSDPSHGEGIQAPTQYMVPRAPMSPQPKRWHLNHFGYFCRAHVCNQQSDTAWRKHLKSGWARQTISLVTYQGPTIILRVQGRKSLQAERAKKFVHLCWQATSFSMPVQNKTLKWAMAT